MATRPRYPGGGERRGDCSCEWVRSTPLPKCMARRARCVVRSLQWRILYRIRRTRMGRSRSAHARSAVKTSAGLLRTVNARQHRSPSERFLPPSSDRIAPASSASSSRTGSMVTPAAARRPRTRRTSTPTSTSFPITSARLAAPSDAEPSSAATKSAPGSSCTRARTAEASRTVTLPSMPPGGARSAVRQPANAAWGPQMPILGVPPLRPPAVRVRLVDLRRGGATGRRGQVRAWSAPRPE